MHIFSLVSKILEERLYGYGYTFQASILKPLPSPLQYIVRRKHRR